MNEIVEKVLVIDSWVTPASAYPEEQIGDYRVGKMQCRTARYNNQGIDGYKSYVLPKPITVTTLEELRGGKWQHWMVDNPTNYRAMQKYAEMASGCVLTTGLGLGLLAHDLCKNDKVESVTIVEMSPAVIALVQKHLPRDNRLKVVWGDFWQYILCDSNKWDWIIVDLWVYTNYERCEEIYIKEVLPASENLKIKYPESQIIFHSFAGMPTIEQLHKSLLSNLSGDYKDTGALLWGLGGDNNTRRITNAEL